MATTPRISNLDLTQNADPVIDLVSADAFYMDSKNVRYVAKTKSGFLEGLGGGGGPENPNTIPQLSDIQSVTKSVYLDTKTNETKAKLVIRIRNSSGKTLSGIDVRIAIPAGSGGN